MGVSGVGLSSGEVFIKKQKGSTMKKSIMKMDLLLSRRYIHDSPAIHIQNAKCKKCMHASATGSCARVSHQVCD